MLVLVAVRAGQSLVWIQNTLVWIQTKKLTCCVDPNQKSQLVWIQTKKLTCVDPNFTIVDPTQKLN